MPKKVRNEEVARHLIKNACAVKLKKIKKYEQQFLALKGKQCYEQLEFINRFKNLLVFRSSREC